MSDTLAKIKRAILDRRYAFSGKARTEMRENGLTEFDVLESVINASSIYKRLRSTSPTRSRLREYLYVIQSPNLSGLPIYTKGVFRRGGETPEFYYFISSKRRL